MPIKSARGARSLGILTFASVVVGGCINHPRNNEHVDNISQIPIQAFTYRQNEYQYVDLFNVAQNRWDSARWQIPGLPAFRENKSGATDSKGVTWYGWNATTWMGDPETYWSSSSVSTHTMTASLRIVGEPVDENNFALAPNQYQGTLSAPQYYYATMNAGSATDACINANLQEGGVKIVQSCQASGPVIHVTADCGRQDQACCPVHNSSLARCDSGLFCAVNTPSYSTCQPRCGGDGQPCCDSEADPFVYCHSGFQCNKDSRTHVRTCNPIPPPPNQCSQAGAACGSGCCSGLSCSSGKCGTTPPVPVRVSGTGTVSCTPDTPFLGGVQAFTCTLFANASAQEQLTSITNRGTRGVMFVKNLAEYRSVCLSGLSSPSSSYALIPANGGSIDLQSVLGTQPSVVGAQSFGVCVLSNTGNDLVSSYILNYGFTKLQ